MVVRTRTAFLVCLVLLGVGLVRGECDLRNVSSCRGRAVCVLVPDRGGTCADVPIGGVLTSTDTNAFPVPVAYFPLSGTHSLIFLQKCAIGDEVTSWPTGAFKGTVKGAVLTEDADFGSVYRCQRDFKDGITLDNIPFGSSGQFAVSLWMKKDVACLSQGDDQFQYLFSTSSSMVSRRTRFDAAAWNQVHMMLPGPGHRRFGSLRAIVNDRNDVDNFFLESETDVDLHDGQWHMLTLSTLPSSRAGRQPSGFRLFIDGEMVAETSRAQTHGGDPLSIDDAIHLCRRADDEEGTYFEGLLTQLSIFDASLTPDQIQEIYKATRESVFAAQPLTRRRRKQNRPLIKYENADMAVRYLRGREVDSGVGGRPVTQQLTTEDMMNGFDYADLRDSTQLCQTNAPACREEEVCAVVHECMLDFLQPKNPKVNAVCTRLPKGESIWNASSTDVPIPVTYFPLTRRRIESWPVGNARGYSVHAQIEEDNVFGSVLSCKKADRSLVVLENVPYGRTGAFGINFWFKVGDLSGRFFQYLFSHGPLVPSSNPWTQNQVQIFLLETEHVGSGVLRAVVKDADDATRAPAGAIFLDSDGDVAKSFMKNASTIANQSISPTDGAWHMITITTHTEREAGFAMYLDGMRVAEIDPEVSYKGHNDIERSIPAGQPLRMGGKIYLCGRYDGSLHRHFDGHIAELSLYDTSLDASEILQLYQAALKVHPELIT